MSLVKSAPLLAPIASFFRLIFVHRLWPDTDAPRLLPQIARASRSGQRSRTASRRPSVCSAKPFSAERRLDARAGRAPRFAAGRTVHLGRGAERVGGQQRDERGRFDGEAVAEQPL